MRLFIALLVCMILLGGMGSAVIQEIDPIKVGSCINLPQLEHNSSYQNLTYILKPDGNIDLISKYMAKNGYSYNYTFCNNWLIGTYTVNGCSDLSCWNYKYSVTPSGFKELGIFLFAFMAIILFIYLIGFKLQNAWIMGLGSILVLIFGFFIIKFGVDIIKDTQTTWAIGLVVWAIGIYSLYLSAEEQLKQWG